MASVAQTIVAPVRTGQRLVALDWMRGIVMVLMAVDHSSGELNAGRLFTDGSFLYTAGTPLPAGQFLTRWITHLCAPTFVFLAGTSLALSITRRVKARESAWSIDRHIALRGVLIVAFELWVSWFWMPHGRYLLQVLYAIGTSFVAMVLLRRLPAPAILTLAAAIVVGGEGLTAAAGWGPPEATPSIAALLLVPGRRGPLIVAYPMLSWLAIMLFGWCFGLWLAKKPPSGAVRRALAVGGAVLLGAFALVRAHNGYGNAGLAREGGALVQWLHVSKYPPSVSFVALELGVMALALALLWGPADRGVANDGGVVVVLGRTPMFFYLLHVPCLVLGAHFLGVSHALGLGATFLGAAVVVAALYPLCRFYAKYKAAHPDAWTRYI